jgi:hypothetical protein
VILRRHDAAVPALTPHDRAWLVLEGERVIGVVAGSGRVWASGRIGPLRSRPVVPVAMADTRSRAVELLRGTA